MSQPGGSTLPQMGSGQANFSTVAVIPQSSNLPIAAFTLELVRALNVIDPSLRLTRDQIENELGSDAFSKSSDFRLSAWLAQQEDKHRIVLYQCDRDLTQWTKLAVRHAWSRTGHQEPVYHTPLPPNNWNKLWIAVKVEDANPL